MKNSSFKELENKIKNAKKILVATHQRPDGDAIGSLVAFGFYLKKLKKSHYLFSVSGVPDYLKFIPGSKKVTSVHPGSKFDLIIALDYGQKNRLGLDGYLKKYPETPILVFDHHIVNGQGGNFGVIYPNYSSTSEIVYDYFKSTGCKVDKKIAFALAVGILTDTGFFKYIKSVKPLEIMVEIVKNFKIKLVEIDNALNGRVKLAALKMSGEISLRAKHEMTGDFVFSWVKRKELTKHHLTTDNIKGIIERLKNVEVGRFALFLIEEKPGFIRGELRGRPDKGFEVAKLAMKLGGGGHKFAAGFRVDGTIDSTLKLVRKYASK